MIRINSLTAELLVKHSWFEVNVITLYSRTQKCRMEIPFCLKHKNYVQLNQLYQANKLIIQYLPNNNFLFFFLVSLKRCFTLLLSLYTHHSFIFIYIHKDQSLSTTWVRFDTPKLVQLLYIAFSHSNNQSCMHCLVKLFAIIILQFRGRGVQKPKMIGSFGWVY